MACAWILGGGWGSRVWNKALCKCFHWWAGFLARTSKLYMKTPTYNSGHALRNWKWRSQYIPVKEVWSDGGYKLITDFKR